MQTPPEGPVPSVAKASVRNVLKVSLVDLEGWDRYNLSKILPSIPKAKWT